MKKKKQLEQQLQELINEQEITDMGELKAGNLAHFFSQLDPESNVVNVGPGQFTVEASDEDIDHLAKVYCGDQEEVSSPKYGVEDDDFTQQSLQDFNTNDYVADTNSMDTAFGEFTALMGEKINKEVQEVVVSNFMHMLDNLVNYQNVKNARTKIEMVKVVDKSK